MRTLLAVTILGSMLCIAGCSGVRSCGCDAPPPRAEVRPAVVVRQAPVVVRPAPPPPAVCNPCAGL